MKNYHLHFAKPFSIFIVGLIFIAFSCQEKEEPQAEELPPIALACDYFNQDRALVNDPERPVDYLIDCFMNINGSSSITIEPGTVIAFSENAGMRIDGTTKFEAMGNSNEPIVFTGTSKSKGHWRGLIFYSSNNSNILQHVEIEYAGGTPFSTTSPAYGGSVAVAHQTSIKFDHLKISNGGSHGMQLTGRESTILASNLTINGNEGVPVQISAYQAHIFDQSSSFSGNSSDYINIVPENYEITQTVSWESLDVPYLVDGRVHIQNNGHLTINEGTEVQFKSGGYLQVASSSNTHNLSLKIQGTASNPVILRGQDGSSWAGISYAFTQENNEIDYAIIENARGDLPVGNITNTGAIYMRANPRLEVTNTIFRDLPNYAFYAYTGASTNQPELPNFITSNNTYTNVTKGSPDLAHLGWGNGSTNHNPQ